MSRRRYVRHRRLKQNRSSSNYSFPQTGFGVILFLGAIIIYWLFTIIKLIWPILLIAAVIVLVVCFGHMVQQQQEEKDAILAELENAAHTPLPNPEPVAAIYPRCETTVLCEFARQVNKYNELLHDIAYKESLIQCYRVRAGAYAGLKNDVESQNCLNKVQMTAQEIVQIQELLSKIRKSFKESYLLVENNQQKESFVNLVTVFSNAVLSTNAPALIKECGVCAVKKNSYSDEILVLLKDFLVVFHEENNAVSYVPYDAIEVTTSSYTSQIKAGTSSEGDVFKGYTYLHAKKDGTPDRRYKENPMLFIVERGSVKIKYADDEYCFEFYLYFSNHNKALACQQSIRNYIEYVKNAGHSKSF